MPASAEGPIEQFVAFVRRRVNLHRLWSALIWAVVAGAGMLAAVGLAYAIQGYAVPNAWIAGSIGFAIAGGVVGWLSSRLNTEQSARFVDKFYNLQDAVASYLHFARSGRTDGYYALQAAHTQRQVEQLTPEAVAYQPPRRGIALAAGLVAVALPLSLRGPSAAVVEQQRQELAIQQTTETANKELKELVEELHQATEDPFEKELLDADKLRKWVASLEVTKDHKEALRQYAQLERELNKARLAIERKKDEQLLDRAAERLKEDRETKPLAEELAQKKYQQAAEKLEEMKPAADKPMSEQRKQLARLKAASQRMAAAARASKSPQAGEQSKSGQKSKAKAAKSGEAKGGQGSSGGEGAGSGEGGGELAENLEELEASVAELDESLKECERQEGEFGECDKKSQSECQACQQSVESKLNKLCKNLTRLAIRRDAENKLCKLCEKCSACQGMCNGQCNKPGAQPGGKKAGWGSNTARREGSDELADNGQTTQLKGQKGAGPSLTTVESAEDGSGVSSRQTAERQRQFQRQFESFVEREDVPEQVKSGVKNYFQLIHQLESEPVAEENNAP